MDALPDLHEMVGGVEDEASFVAFVAALADDFAASARLEKKMPSSPYGPAALGWENTSVDGFLEAGAAWPKDSAGEMRAASANAWHRCAAILVTGKYYE